MKKIALFLIGISIVLTISGCSSKNDDNSNNELSDYKPMIYVQDNLYGETSDVVDALPDETVYIGTINKLVSQSEPMVHENFTSNTLPEGSELYYNESDPDVVYVKLPDTNQVRYSKYTIIK
ncbi:hypothetical protein GCM10023142_36110 [Anaerocolumna aminovalerica]|jgi:hypothetical protein|uniref:Lipoprotein n=1 Tax=Anaerocolumna aminovalerica TaxID=1527 RepID=A0A1I5IL16_9FIRM|nr:hypothetical protein [Anaerocolumna aminovalerica]MBU5334314.1 hypothetical protein [Anaerocolumna aminovalerica]MDU6266755.1 hypothetical protein [Anaerocolumna aminovalerica]SFO61122.1 hypothetical protein SAMN04489757_14715 [Anaerocolumna aminovalerica]